MYYSFNANHNSMAADLTRSAWRVLRNAVYLTEWMVICCGREEAGNIKELVWRKMKTVTLIGKDR
jgi:hypothetical protein